MDTEWSRLSEGWERLRWARGYAQVATATAAAESMGMKKDTYSAYEREPGKSKHTEMDHQSAIKFGRRYKVSWTWLLLGEGTPFDRPTNAFQQRVLEAMATANDTQQRRVADAVEALLSTGTDG